MKVFYVCRTGYHTSVLAASLHLGYISHDADAKKIYSLSGYDKLNPDEIGKPYLAGIDDRDDEVYTIGVTGENHLMVRAAGELMTILGVSPGDWRIIDTSVISSNWTLIGQLLRKIHFNTLSKAFFYLGARKEIPRLINVVARENR
jgi:hypothetical protein